MAHNGDIQIIIFIILWLEHIIGDGVHIKTQKPNYFTNCCTGRVNKKLSGLMSRSANSPQTTILVWSQRRHQRWKLTYIVDSENFSPLHWALSRSSTSPGSISTWHPSPAHLLGLRGLSGQAAPLGLVQQGQVIGTLCKQTVPHRAESTMKSVFTFQRSRWADARRDKHCCCGRPGTDAADASLA